MEKEQTPTQVEENTEEATETNQRTFTQDEVEKMIKKRLARAYQERVPDPKVVELEQREKTILAKEILFDREMPRELANIISFNDENDLLEKLDTLSKLFPTKKESTESAGGFQQIGSSLEPTKRGITDPIREAMRIK